MYKLSLVFLLVSSTFLCQARPDGGNVLNAPSPAASPIEHPNVPKSEHVKPVDISQVGTSTDPSSTKHVSIATNDKSTSISHTPPPPPPSSSSTTTTPTTKPTTTTTTTTAKPTTSRPTTSSSTHEPTSKPTTSSTPSPHSSTTPPASSTTNDPKPDPSHRDGFSIVSFLGGMILGLGLLAIAYVVFKFYQTRRDSSYRTL